MMTTTGEASKEANNKPMASMEGIEETVVEGKELNMGPVSSKEELDSEVGLKVSMGEGTEENRENLEVEGEEKRMSSPDQESPRGVLDIPISGLESDGGSSNESSPLEKSRVAESHILHWKNMFGGMLMRKKRAMTMRRLSTFPQAVFDAGLHKKLAKIQCDEDLMEGEGPKPEVLRRRSSWRSFGRRELVAAVTDNFSQGAEENKDNLNVDRVADTIMSSSDQDSPPVLLEVPVPDLESDSSGSSSESSSLDQSIVVGSHTLHWRSLLGGLFLRKKRSMLRLSTFPSALPAGASLQRSLPEIHCDDNQTEDVESQPEVSSGSPSWRSFDWQELAAATDNFDPEKLIGKGGHAEVYMGTLPDGQVIAVKKLTKGECEQRIRDFLSELGIIAHVNHPNAAQLLGFSVEKGLHLVLRFSPHGSLASVLHGSKDGLDWGNRFKIALGIAQGLFYLHEGCQRRIIHRDIKASNILLTDDYQPQISDFGLAKWLPDKWSHHVVFPIEGTFGYLAPEYFMHGIVNEKTDVFAFGVLLLELLTGRKAVDSSRQSLVIWAKPLLEKCNMKELVDPSLMGAYDSEEARRIVSAASMCIHHLSTMRPNMNWVVRLLKDEERVAEFVAREPSRRPLLFDAGDSVDYTCSRYLNDLHRHKELAMEQ